MAASAWVSGSAGAEEELPIVDTHQHLWDLKKFRLPWLTKGGPLTRDYLPEDYRAATAGLNVVQSVYVEVDVTPAQQFAEAEYVVNLCKKKEIPLVGAVVGGRPDAPDFADYLAKLTQLDSAKHIKGVRRVLHGNLTPPGHCLTPAFIRGVRKLGEQGLSFDLCLRASDLLDAEKLISQCPDTSFILDHCGNPPVQARDLSDWRRDLERLARHERLHCKVSGIVASAKVGAWTAQDLEPIIKFTLDTFGPDRVVFGGDWPVCTLTATFRQWVEALRLIVHERPRLEQRKLFHDNAVRFYRLQQK